MKNKWNYPEKVDQLRFTKNHQQKVLNRLHTPLQKKKPRKYVYSGLTAVAIVLLLFGGTFFAPTMEQVIAKIPYISNFIEQEDERMAEMESILADINHVVDKNEMNIGDVQIETQEKEITLFLIGLAENSEHITDQIYTQLDKTGYSNYQVEVAPYEEKEIQTERTEEEIQQYMQDTEALRTSIAERLKEEEYELMFPIQVRINDVEGTYVNVIVPESENRLEQLKEIMKEEAKAYGDEYKLDVRQVEKIARKQEKRWQETGAISHIARALMEGEKFPVTGFSHSFHPYPLQIKVKTSLDGNDSEAKQIAEEIRSEIDLFIQTDEKTETIGDDRYEVKVLNKDKKEIK
ncbi:DUF4030 domain-containing protein [Oceanobacillus halotolerans]|uniref:DUF4030 domain-containing protein n=1 Tax=Oceanobacillus halotolerans TaxID=2663380 RepID=UPI0013DABE23|nr:DUF4030 domain-containing protein [Oceanobacillus halotolerans]